MASPFLQKFAAARPVIGVIHCDALPGTPKGQSCPGAIAERAAAEAAVYEEAGIDGLIVENMHDRPYLKRAVGPEITAAMTAVALAAKAAFSRGPCGIQILAGANQAALAVARAAGLDFIRAEGFVFQHIADEGAIDADAGALLRYRKAIGAEDIAVLTDIKKKHSSHAITADLDLVETARAAAFFLSEGLVISGPSTGAATDLAEVRAVKAAVDLPVLVGSGVIAEQVEASLDAADALIVGSYFKEEGRWDRPLDRRRIDALMDRVRAWRA